MPLICLPSVDMLDRRNTLLLSVPLVLVLVVSGSTFVVELDDTFMETRGADDIWLIKFYAPWCTFCKQLDPVWHQIGSELRSLGSLINVGKSDATKSMGLAKDFRVINYPAILMLKKDVKYNYPGPRTKEGIMDFANRVAGPLVRSLSSVQLFQHAMKHHNVMIVYVGATSPLKRCPSKGLRPDTPACRPDPPPCRPDRPVRRPDPPIRRPDPSTVSLPSLPAVVVFKDGTYFTFNEELDGDLKSWINRERFPNYFKIDSYTLYSMGESGKLVLVVLVEEKGQCEESLRFRGLVEKVAADYREIYSRHFHFGFMEGSDYINGFVMGQVTLPSFIALNLSNDGYFLPLGAMETESHLLDFLNGILDGSIQCQGGNSAYQCMRRLIYDIRVTLTLVFIQAPLLGCLLVSIPFVMAAMFCYLCCKHPPIQSDDDDGIAMLAPSLPRRKQTNKKSD